MSLKIPSRRSFLFGAATILTTPALVRASSLMPVSVLRPPKLWGDGQHDDTAALQWLVDHLKPDETTVFPQGGIYKISKEIIFKDISDISISNCSFVAGKPLDCVLSFDRCKGVRVTDVIFKNTSYQSKWGNIL